MLPVGSSGQFVSLVRQNVHFGPRLHANDAAVNKEVSAALGVCGHRDRSADCGNCYKRD